MSRIGIYSGTFDPVHKGHLAFSLEALQICRLEEVVLIPEETPRGKPAVTAMAHRVALLEETVRTMNDLRVLTLDSKQFTVGETLPELLHVFKGDELTLLVGSDVVCSFLHNWQGLDFLLDTVSFAVGMRQGDTVEDVHIVMRSLEKKYKLAVSYVCITTPYTSTASSHIRKRKWEAGLIFTAQDYIRKYGLYNK